MKKIKLISLIAIASVGVIAAGSIPLVAKLNHLSYLNGIKEGNSSSIGNNSSQQTNQELILEGITAKLKEGVGYYDNGRAVPKFDDFEVYAHYKKGGEESEERLYDDQVKMVVPEGFVENGGTIQFTYKDHTFDFPVTLEKVAISKIKIVENPFVVYYKEGERLDINGIKVEGVNNDGSPCKVNVSDIIANSGELTAGMSEGVVLLKGNENVKGSFPITVVEEKDYDEGTLVSYETDGSNLLVKDGDKLSEADLSSLEVLAKYSCGNKKLLGKDKIAIEEGDKIISFGADLKTKIKIHDGDFSDELVVKIMTEKTLGAESSLTMEGFEKKTGNVYEIKEDGSFAETSTNETVLSSLKDAESQKVTFKFNSASFTTADVDIDLSLPYEKEGDDYASKTFALNQALSLKVNGISKTVSNDAMSKKVTNSDESKIKSAFQKLSLRNVDVIEGENTIEITVLGDYKKEDLALRNVCLTSLGDVPEYSFPSYLEGHELAKKDKMAEADFSSIKNYSFFKDSTGDLKIPYSSFIDNGYLYTFLGAYEGRKAALVKYDFDTMSQILSNMIIPEHAAEWGMLGGIVDLGGDELGLVRMDQGGSQTHDVTIYNKNTLAEIGKKITFHFPWNVVVRGLTFNKTLRRFAAYDGERTWLLDEEGNVLKQDFISKFTSWGDLTKHENITDLSGNDDYIVVIAQYGESEEPGNKQNYDFRTLVFDWEGNEVYHTPDGQKYRFDYTKMPVAEPWKYWNFGPGWESRAYQLIMDGDDTYLMCTKIANDGFFISSPSFVPNFAKHFDPTTLGGYIGKAANEEKVAKFDNKLLNAEGYKISIPYNGENKEGIIDSVVALNGKAYASISVNGGSQAAILAELEVTSEGVSIKRQSDVFELVTEENQEAEWTKATTIFTKDGKLGVFNNRNATMSFYDPTTLKKIPDSDLTVTGTNRTAIYGTYSDIHKKYVFFDGDKFYFADENGSLTEEGFGNKQPDKDEGLDSNVLNMQLTTDGDYIYMLYTQDGSYNAKIKIYDWDGQEVGMATVPLNGTVDGTGEFKKFNVKNIFFLNGKLYLDVFAHDGKGNFTYEASYDQTIFAKA